MNRNESERRQTKKKKKKRNTPSLSEINKVYNVLQYIMSLDISIGQKKKENTEA